LKDGPNGRIFFESKEEKIRATCMNMFGSFCQSSNESHHETSMQMAGEMV
jgi:hypothetical protein